VVKVNTTEFKCSTAFSQSGGAPRTTLKHWLKQALHVFDDVYHKQKHMNDANVKSYARVRTDCESSVQQAASTSQGSLDVRLNLTPFRKFRSTTINVAKRPSDQCLQSICGEKKHAAIISDVSAQVQSA